MAKSSPSEELWVQARATLERITSGELTATRSQVSRLKKLIEGYEAWVETDLEVKRFAIALLYERQTYLSRLWFLERLGIENAWGHDLLQSMQKVIYEETDEFKLIDFMPPQAPSPQP